MKNADEHIKIRGLASTELRARMKFFIQVPLAIAEEENMGAMEKLVWCTLYTCDYMNWGPTTKLKLSQVLGRSKRQIDRVLSNLEAAGWLRPAPNDSQVRVYELADVENHTLFPQLNTNDVTTESHTSDLDSTEHSTGQKVLVRHFRRQKVALSGAKKSHFLASEVSQNEPLSLYKNLEVKNELKNTPLKGRSEIVGSEIQKESQEDGGGVESTNDGKSPSLVTPTHTRVPRTIWNHGSQHGGSQTSSAAKARPSRDDFTTSSKPREERPPTDIHATMKKTRSTQDTHQSKTEKRIRDENWFKPNGEPDAKLVKKIWNLAWGDYLKLNNLMENLEGGDAKYWVEQEFTGAELAQVKRVLKEYKGPFFLRMLQITMLYWNSLVDERRKREGGDFWDIPDTPTWAYFYKKRREWAAKVGPINDYQRAVLGWIGSVDKGLNEENS